MCDSIFNGLTQPLPLASDPQGGCLSFAQFIHRRNRTVDAINHLNCTLIPPLDIRTLSAGRVTDYTAGESNDAGRGRVSRGCQTVLTGEVQSTRAPRSEGGDIRRAVSSKTGQNRFLCSLCGLEYKWRSSVYRHVKQDHEVNREVCVYCYVPFSNRTLLYAHLQLRQELGWCRASRGIEGTETAMVVPTPVGVGMPALYDSVELWR